MRQPWTRLDSDTYANKVRSVAERFNAVQSLSRRLQQSALSRRSHLSPRLLPLERRKTSSRPDADDRAKRPEGTRSADPQRDRDAPSAQPKLRKHIHPCVCDISPAKLRQIDQMVESRRLSRAELQRRLERVHEFLRTRTDSTRRRDEADAVRQRVRAAKMRSEVERKARIEASAKDAESRLGTRQTPTRRPRRRGDDDDSLLKPIEDDLDDLDDIPPPPKPITRPTRRPARAAVGRAAGRSKQSPKSTDSSKSSPKATQSPRQKGKRRSTPSPKRAKPKRGRRDSLDDEDDEGRPESRDRGGRGGRRESRGPKDRGGRRGGRDREDRGGRRKSSDQEERGGRQGRRGKQDRGRRQDRGERQGRGRRDEQEDFEDGDEGGGRQAGRGRQGRGGRQQRADSKGQLTPKELRAQQREKDRERRQQQRETRQRARSTPSVQRKMQKVVIRKVRRQPAPEYDSYSTLEPRERIDWRKAPTLQVRETKTSRLRKLESGCCGARSRMRVVEKRYRSLTPERVREIIRRPPPSQARLTRTASLRLERAKKLDLSPKTKYRRPSFEAGYNLMLKYRPWPDPVKWKIKATASLTIRTGASKGDGTAGGIRKDVKPQTKSGQYGSPTSTTKPAGGPPYGTTTFAPGARMTTGRSGAAPTGSTVGATTRGPTAFTQGTGAATTRGPTAGAMGALSPTTRGLALTVKSPTTKSSPAANTTGLTPGTTSATTKSSGQSTGSSTSGTKPSTGSPTQTMRPAEGKSTSPTPSTTSRTQSTKATTQTQGTSGSTSATKPTAKGPEPSKS